MTRMVIVLGIIVAVLATTLAWLTFKDNPWKARARTAETQSALNTTTGAIADKAAQNTTRIIIQSEGLAHAAETASGGGAPVPPAVLDSWRSGVGGLRQRPTTDSAGHPAQPAG